MHSKKIYIQGMHCASCEKLLTGEFRNISDVTDIKIDRKSDSAEIFFEEKEPDFEKIKNTAEKFGYTIFEDKSDAREKKTGWETWVQAFLIIAILLFVYRYFSRSGLLSGFQTGGQSITYGVSFLIGLAASVSSCLAVVGAVVIAFSEKYQNEKNSFYEGAVRPNLIFHIGRLGTFFILGGILGAVGGQLNISGNIISIYTIIIAVIMGWLGLNILGFVPSFTTIGIKMPQFFGARWEKLKKSEHKAAPFVLGGLSFFLPCGFTQTMQLFALASGSFFTGGFSLFLFALGTVPTLLVLGITASWTKNRGFVVFQKVAGMIIIIFAVYTLNSGLALKGVKTNIISSTAGKEQSEAKNNIAELPSQKEANQAEQVVEMNVTSSGFEPAIFKVKQGIPVKWVINGVNVSGCTSTIIVPSFDISKNLKYGENVVQFTPSKKGEIAFSCGMGMVRGKFIVEQ